MKRLHYVNLLGVLALAALCLAQWTQDRRLHLEVNRLEQVRLEQEAKLAEQVRVMTGLTADLTQFKELVSRAQAESETSRQKADAAEAMTRQLTAEGKQLKLSLTNWASAVTVREERLKEANAQLRKLGEELNMSLKKFNDLAANHNMLVQRFNRLPAQETR